ncbi:MAG: hypothetical protein ABIE70_02075 [bacterium]
MTTNGINAERPHRHPWLRLGLVALVVVVMIVLLVLLWSPVVDVAV